MNTYKHSGGFGDIIFSVPTVIATGGGTFYLQDHQAGVLGKLLDVQPCIRNTVTLPLAEWEKIGVSHNLDLFRQDGDNNIMKMHLNAFKVDFDLSQKWLFNIEPKRVAPIVVFDTGRQRWPGHTVDWNVLRGYENYCVFIGYDIDYEIFLQDKKINLCRYQVPDLYEFARVIEGCDLFICNISCVCAVGEGLKKPRVVDEYIGRPQYPFGEDAYTELTTEIIEKYLRRDKPCTE